MDIRTDFLEKDAEFDWLLGPYGLAEDEGLRTAVIISLFSDRRADDQDVLPDNSTARRGWWGDTFADIDGDQIGSKLWLLSREKQLPDVLQRARDYARDSLTWMLEDDIAKSVDVAAKWLRQSVMQLDIDITRVDGTVHHYQFDWFWNSENGI